MENMTTLSTEAKGTAGGRSGVGATEVATGTAGGWAPAGGAGWAEHGAWLRNADQVAVARESTVDGGPAHWCRGIDLRVAGGLDLRVLPDRGLDIGEAWFAGLPLAWVSPVGECAPLPFPEGRAWADAFGGGLLATCGLRNVGAPSEGHGLHGRIAHSRAEGVAVRRSEADGEYRLTVTGTVADATGLGGRLELHRTLTTGTGRGHLELTDVTTNRSGCPEAAPLLYHVNLGAPLWGPGSRLHVPAPDGSGPLPRDDDARAGLDEWATAPVPDPAAPEQVFEHAVAPGPDGWATVRVDSPAAGLRLEISWDATVLPRLHQWRHPGQAVLGIEPANCSVLGRAADREAGRLPVLAPGEQRTSRLRLAVGPVPG